MNYFLLAIVCFAFAVWITPPKNTFPVGPYLVTVTTR